MAWSTGLYESMIGATKLNRTARVRDFDELAGPSDERLPVWSKKSCSACVVLQQPAETLLADNRHGGSGCVNWGREQQYVALALMVSLRVIVLEIFGENSPKRCLIK